MAETMCKFWNTKCQTCMALWGAITELQECFVGHIVLEDGNVTDDCLRFDLDKIENDERYKSKASAPIYKLFLEIMLTLPIESRRAIMCTTYEVNRETGECWWKDSGKGRTCENCDIPDLSVPI